MAWSVIGDPKERELEIPTVGGHPPGTKEAQSSSMNIQETDVLVVGGGGAGMRAALAAREQGCRVLLVSKTPIGKTTCTYLSGGMFSVAGKEMSKETHLERTLQAGKGINSRELVEILTEEAPERVRELEGFGLAGQWESERFYCLGKPPAWGAPLAGALAKACEGQGISLLPWVMIGQLLVQEGRVVGALGLDFRKGKPIAIQTRAMILANGGGSALYQRNDNPVRITGDGYALAFHAGCHLRDMEFVQFLPTGLAEPGKPPFIIATILCDYGKITNSAGENILEKYNITERPVAVRSRDSLSLAIFQEEKEGEKVFLDLRFLSEDDWPQEHMALSQRAFLLKHLSCSKKPLPISPLCHHFMGGVAIDSNGRTDMAGLFAAGEVSGGVHGANRMGGNALAEILVFGYRAGASAGRWVKTQEKQKGLEGCFGQELSAFQKKIQQGGSGPPARDLKKMVGKILWENAGILREEKGLRLALEGLLQMREESLPRVKVQNPKELLEKMEVENALWVGEMIIRSALMREESRGAHFRKDFSKSDDQKWKGNIFLQKSATGMQLGFLPLP
jgi:fumarate reductase (CoM/CoB) subunit A